MGHWIKVRFRDDVVWARCTAAGELSLVDGFVPFAYKAGGKAYKTRPDRLAGIPGEGPVADPAPAAAAPASAPGSAPASAPTPAAKSARSRPAAASGSKPKAFVAGDYTMRRPEEEAVQLWTDGACTGNPGPAGLGVLYMHRGEVKELSEYLGQGTNNIAELTAILRGLQLVEDRTTPVDVITDSSYCIGLLSKGWKAKKNQALVAELRALLATFSDVRLLKVPGHAGVPGNERADELATGAILAR